MNVSDDAKRAVGAAFQKLVTGGGYDARELAYALLSLARRLVDALDGRGAAERHCHAEAAEQPRKGH